MSDDATPPDGIVAGIASAVTRDRWGELRRYTDARIALSRAGGSLPTREVLNFALAHARARDAVHTPLDAGRLAAEIRALGLVPFETRSRAADRSAYLTRPDYGRRLPEAERAAIAARAAGPVDIAIVVADGLSSAAVHENAAPFLAALLPRLVKVGHSVAPVAIVSQGRVAIADEIGALLGARMALILIGERPGLSSVDSLGVYSTYEPRLGRNDAERNCISNIRPEGLPPAAAAATAEWLINETLVRRISGVSLKDSSGLPEEAAAALGGQPEV